MESELTLTEIPKKIKEAANLIYLTLAIGFIKYILYVTMTSQKTFTEPRSIIIGILTIIILALFAFKIGEGKNWSRITYLVLFIIGIIPYPLYLSNEFKMSPIIGIVSITQVLIQLYVLVILFTGESKEWFKKQKTKTE
jgi:membrane-associated HD superfamily phosphohydrolase